MDAWQTIEAFYPGYTFDWQAENQMLSIRLLFFAVFFLDFAQFGLEVLTVFAFDSINPIALH